MTASRWRSIEAKKIQRRSKSRSQEQAKLYAGCLEAMHGQRPIIFYTERVRDLSLGRPGLHPARSSLAFYKKDELASLLHRRTHREPLNVDAA